MKQIQRFDRILLILLCLLIVGHVIRVVCAGSTFPASDTPQALHITDADWTVTQEPAGAFLGFRQVYTFRIPTEIPVGSSLILYVKHQYCTVLIDGAQRFSYENGAPHFVRTSGNYWVRVRLTKTDTGKPVQIRLTPVFKTSQMPDIRICPQDLVISGVLKDDLFLLLLSALTITTGIALSSLALSTFLKKRTRRTLLCLSLLTINSGIWKVCGLPVTTLLLSYASPNPFLEPKAIYLYGMLSFLVMPIFSFQFLSSIRRSYDDRFSRLCAIVMETSVIALLTLQLTGVLELHETISFVMVEISVLVLVMFGMLMRQRETIWLIIFPIAIGADLLISVFSDSVRYVIALMICILVNDYVYSALFLRRAIRQASELRDARTTALMHQIQPHFIHNTLTSIYYLCDSDPQTAKQLVRDFNSHLRANFTSLSANQPVPFPEELEHVRAYLSVEHVRFSDKLFVEYDTPHTSFRLPALTLQPLVENAVKHNVDSSKPPVHIRIRTFACDGGSTVVIEDDGSGTINPPDEHAHVGLQNVADRLQMLCGGTLRVEPRAEGGCIVTVFVPDEAQES